MKLVLQTPIYVKPDIKIYDYLTSYECKVYEKIDNIHSLLSYNKTESTYKSSELTKQKKSNNEMFPAVSDIEGYLNSEL